MASTAHTVTLNTSSSIIVGHWGCACGRWGIANKAGLSTAALRVRLRALAEQHLDDAGAELADYDALLGAL